MSTEILHLRGKKEIPNPRTRTCDYEHQNLSISRFWGGEERGICLQFTIWGASDNTHIQLNENTVNYLATVLSDWRNANEEDK